jgi:hypothetical protein
MRARYSRHLRPLLEPETRPPVVFAKSAKAFSLMATPGAAPPPRTSNGMPISPELSGTQYAIFLLHIAAQIEHSLMAEYLFSGYTLGGPHVDPKYTDTIQRWQEVILGVAKEEMGHLITVQNVLRLISGPVTFERQELPYNAEFYPFFFSRERLTLDVLAKYVWAEMPPDWDDPLKKEIFERAQQANDGAPVKHVGPLYTQMIDTIGNDSIVPDSAFRAESVAYQASWEEWGRGYSHGNRGNFHRGSPAGTPDLIIHLVKDRPSAVTALKDIANQGEATFFEGELSHFRRFLDIYREWKAVLEKDRKFDPSRPVAANPVVYASLPETAEKTKVSADPREENEITHPVTFYWAHLFNVRYRLLLTGLTHTFSLRGSLASTTKPSARGDILTLVFSEMYKIRGLASVLVAQPLRSDTPVEEAAAGPPFQMPFTLELPDRDDERLRWYRDMIDASRDILETLRAIDRDERRTQFAKAMLDADDETLQLLGRLIAHAEAAEEVAR